MLQSQFVDVTEDLSACLTAYLLLNAQPRGTKPVTSKSQIKSRYAKSQIFDNKDCNLKPKIPNLNPNL